MVGRLVLTAKNDRTIRDALSVGMITQIKHWYRSKLEELGKIVLIKADGHIEKVERYKRGLRRLILDIEVAFKDCKSPEVAEELRMLYINSCRLEKFVSSHI